MSEALLRVEGLTLSFGGLRALDDVDLEVPERAIVGLIGPNGAGKTTTFNVVSGLQRADAGRVWFGGRDVTALPAHRRAALGMGRSFQNLGLIGGETVLVNVLAAQHLGSNYSGTDLLARPWRWRANERRLRGRAIEVLTAFGLGDRLQTRVEDLSFAAARFVELACVLVERPRLMLLDEPTTGLDLVENELLLDALRTQREEGTTILLVAHDVKFVMRLCDHVYVLSEGRVLSHGLPGEVQRDPAVIEAYLGRSA